MRSMKWKRKVLAAWMVVMSAVWFYGPTMAVAQVVPGTGYKLSETGDDFEKEDWEFVPNWPKASQNLNGDTQHPLGEVNNGRWYESAYRGAPDIVRRVPTPAGGIPGSKGSLLLQTKFPGIPNMITRQQQQDDFLCNVNGIVGALPVSLTPSVVARVKIPEWKEFEQRTGSSFGFRADCEGTMTKSGSKDGLFGKKMFSRTVQDAYWPGFFIQYNCKATGQYDRDSAIILIRSDEMGRDLFGPTITEPGWWTLGMTFSPDGRVHYYASPGVDRLTQQDYITSQSPYGARTQHMTTFFFNVVTMDDGRTWSTPWVVDDPEVYVLHRPAVQQQ